MHEFFNAYLLHRTKMFYCLAGIVDIEGLKTSIHQAIHYCFIEKGLEATYHK